MLINDQESFKDVYKVLNKVVDQMKNDIFLSFGKKGNKNLFNFAYYKTDKNFEVYDLLKESNKDILKEVDYFETYRG